MQRKMKRLITLESLEQHLSSHRLLLFVLAEDDLTLVQAYNIEHPEELSSVDQVERADGWN